MPKKIPVPDIKYVCVSEADDKALDAAFDYLFELLIKEVSANKDLTRKE
jgi:hypothetical protein